MLMKGVQHEAIHRKMDYFITTNESVCEYSNLTSNSCSIELQLGTSEIIFRYFFGFGGLGLFFPLQDQRGILYL